VKSNCDHTRRPGGKHDPELRPYVKNEKDLEDEGRRPNELNEFAHRPVEQREMGPLRQSEDQTEYDGDTVAQQCCEDGVAGGLDKPRLYVPHKFPTPVKHI
jgi:hypothetical protein